MVDRLLDRHGFRKRGSDEPDSDGGEEPVQLSLLP
jgi:hypothetical protein